MLAAVYHNPNDLRVEEVPIPDISPDEVLIKVKAASICGTDLRILHGNHRLYPAGTVRIPGHEITGVVIKAGSRVQSVPIEQTVFIAPNIGCGHCRQCVSGNNNLCSNFEALGITMDGGFAEYMRVPAPAIRQGNIIPITSEIDAAAAALIEPLACVLRSHDLLKIRPGDNVLVVGAGPIGVLHIQMARLAGASCIVVSDPNEERLKIALELGADFGINPSQENLIKFISEKTAGYGMDVIIVAAPAHVAQESALELAAIRGRICFFGGLPKDRPTIQFNSNLVHYKELLITATTGSSTENCWRASQIVNSGRIDLSALISLHSPLDQAIEAFQAAESGKVMKVVLEP